MGYWEPHTASIDFCEENYRFTPYVAELLNSITSLPIAIVGTWAWCVTPEPYRRRLPFALTWFSFIVIGLGSAAFHATLRRHMQALDELPMVMANLSMLYCLSLPRCQRPTMLAAVLSACAVALTVAYWIFEAYGVFITMYGSVVVYLTLQSRRLAFAAPKERNGPVLVRLWRVAFTLYGAGVVLWVADNLACTQMGFGHLHILWHGLACVGTMVFVFLLVALNMDADGLRPELAFRGPWLPYVVMLEPGGKKGS
mmetsp:Transcript_8643/g.19739  ORF Transcript_8643/g.19739 Transcript_8643/m.19739 type:complete len:255 (+) Transcript_8643:59-823(+)